MLTKPQLNKKENKIDELPFKQTQFYLKIDSNNPSPVVWVELNGILKKLEHLKDRKKKDSATNIKNQKTIHITLSYE